MAGSAENPVRAVSPWYVVQPEPVEAADPDEDADGDGAGAGDVWAGEGGFEPPHAASSAPTVRVATAGGTRRRANLTWPVSPAPATECAGSGAGRRAGDGAGDTGQVIGLDLALSLRVAGLRWTPRPGDRFVLPHRGMDEDVFVLSDMTVEVHRFPTGSVIGFNGVTEWALDSIDQHEAVWMPAEHQLREMLGGLFVRLESGNDGFEVTLELPSGRSSHRASTAEDAYGHALLAVLREVTGSLAEPTVR